MGKQGIEHIDDYFMSVNRTKVSLRVEPFRIGNQSELYRLSVIDSNGIRVVDSEDLDLPGYQRKAGSLANTLRLKYFDVSVVEGMASNP